MEILTNSKGKGVVAIMSYAEMNPILRREGKAGLNKFEQDVIDTGIANICVDKPFLQMMGRGSLIEYAEREGAK